MKDKITPSNEPEVKPETVFEIGAEGGSLRIFRQRDGSVDKFIIYHNEFDPLADDDATLVNIKKEYKTFNLAFQYIERFPWYGLYIVDVHKDFRDFILERLNEMLIKKSISTDPSNYDSAEVIPRIQENLLRSISEWDRH
jgi:hypothetical protein